jgi:hypothetical protein
LKLSKRFLAVVAVPAVLAGLMLAGAASSAPTVMAGTSFGNVTFQAIGIPGTTTFTLESTSCTLKETGGGAAVPCFLSGAGTYNNQGNIATADVAITSKFGPISLDFTGLHSSCAVASGVAITKPGPVPVVATLPGPVNPNSAGVVSGTIKIWNTGTTSKGCSDS